MDVDAPIIPFQDLKLLGLASFLGFDDPRSVIESGVTVEFSKLVSSLCGEIATLYNLDDDVNPFDDDKNVLGFLFDVSAFLSELECSIVEISVGSLEERFDSTLKRSILISFLCSELKAARLFAHMELQKPCTSSDTTEDLWSNVKSALNVLEVPKPNVQITPVEIIRLLNTKADSRLQFYSKKPEIIFKDAINENKTKQLDEIVKILSNDCKSRTLLLLKRVDVTINSFLWAERLKQQENEIRQLFLKKREKMAVTSPCDLVGLLSATEDVLEIERVSSRERRLNTRSIPHPLSMASRPLDRGGRTNEMEEVKTETFNQQRGPRGGGYRGRGGDRGRGGGHHNRGRGGDHNNRGGRGNYRNSDEQQVRQEYANRNRGY